MSQTVLAKRLKDELLTRTRRNPRYSLRAFAKQLSIEPSLLSKILRGHRLPGRRTAAKIIDLLGEASLSPHSNTYEPLVEDQFRLISDWYHYAILEIVKIEGFTKDSRSISRALGISAIEATDACERLVRLGLLKVSRTGKFQSLDKNCSTLSTPSTNAAFRNLQRGILEKALKALDEVPIEKRDQTSMTMALDPKMIPAAKEKIKEMRRELCQWLESQGRPSEVFHLSVSLYPVSQTRLRIPQGEKSL